MHNGSQGATAARRRPTALVGRLPISPSSSSPAPYAEQHPADVADAAERALDGDLHVLKIPGEALLRPHRIAVVAGDAIENTGGTGGLVTAGTTSDLNSDVVTTVFTAASPGIGLGEHLARVVLHRLTAAVPNDGPQSDAAVRQRRGAAVLHRRSGPIRGPSRGPSAVVGDPRGRGRREALCRACLASQMAVAAVPGDRGRPGACRRPGALRCDAGGVQRLPAWNAMACASSCGSWPGRGRDPNHSAEIIYGKTLELLETEWIVRLRGDMGRRLVSLLELLQARLALAAPIPLASGRVPGADAHRQHQHPGHAVPDPQPGGPARRSNEAKADPWGYGLDRVELDLVVMVVAGHVQPLLDRPAGLRGQRARAEHPPRHARGHTSTGSTAWARLLLADADWRSDGPLHERHVAPGRSARPDDGLQHLLHRCCS